MQASNKFILPALILNIFLGLFGAHRFYAGRYITAVIQLLLTCTIAGVWITLIWIFVDFILIVIGAFKDGKGQKITMWVNK